MPLFNNATGDFGTAISGRLCHEVIRMGMHDYTAPKNFRNGKRVRQKRLPGVAIAIQKGWQVAAMVWMLEIVRVIMISGIGKVVASIFGAVSVFVDMETKEVGRSFFCYGWQPSKLCIYEHSVGHLIEGYDTN